METRRKPKLAVWKLTSCNGCQLALLDCEEQLMALAGHVEIAFFPTASRAAARGPFDIALVEGSISTASDAERIRNIRRVSRCLVAVGACATAGGIQALRNLAGLRDLIPAVRAAPECLAVLEHVSPVAQHVRVDLELRGCPINKAQLLEVVSAHRHGRAPRLPAYSVCFECKRRGVPCVMVARSIPCLGPLTQAGCGAICPSFERGCYGCFGPMETPNPPALQRAWESLGASSQDLLRVFRCFNPEAPAFRTTAPDS